MNFSSDSIKHDSKTQSEDFYFNLETPRGHFFAVLDFAPHDFANLNATLKGKLETIVGSFVSLSRFSADLFLGFLAKEINNFLYNLREQAGGPELLCSAGLCLVSGNRLTYFLCGDVGINIHNGGRVLPLQGGEFEGPGKLERLGGHSQEGPLSDQVQTFTLQDNDVVLIMTQGLEATFETQELSNQIGALNSSDPKLICDALMKAGASSRDDRTLVVISGPYDRYVDPVLADLSKAVVSLEARLNSLAEREPEKTPASPPTESGAAVNELEKRLAGQLDSLKDELKSKAARIDFLELEEKVKDFGTLLGSKADTAEVLTLQSDVLKLGIAVGAAESSVSKEPTSVTSADVPATGVAGVELTSGRQRPSLLRTALLALVIGLAAGFTGAWLQSRTIRKQQEVWSVKTAGNQVLISRLDEGGTPGSMTLNVSRPLQSTEQNFSSFADARRYIDTLTAPAEDSQTTSPNETPNNNAAAEVAEITVKPGDSLRKLSQQHNVSEEQIKELNPTIKKWSSLRSGQHVVVPVPASANTSASPATTPATSSSLPVTIEITVGPGDSINRFALRYNTTPERLRELNPNITNWANIQTGQKVLVPGPPSG